MANTTVQLQLDSGLTGLTLTLYADGSDTAGNTPDTLTEETNRLGLYTATVTEALAGDYYANVLSGSSFIGSGWVTLADDTGTYEVGSGKPGTGSLTQQQVANAMLLAPAGTAATGSVAKDLDTLTARITASATTSAAGATGDFSTAIVRGDAYNSASGNAFSVSSAGFPAAVWDAVVTGTLKIKQGETYTTTGTVVVTHDSDETITATISFTSAQTAALVASINTTYQIEFTVGTDKRTLTGKWPVVESDEA